MCWQTNAWDVVEGRSPHREDSKEETKITGGNTSKIVQET